MEPPLGYGKMSQTQTPTGGWGMGRGLKRKLQGDRISGRRQEEGRKAEQNKVTQTKQAL